MLIKRRKNLLSTLWQLNGSSFEQTWIPFMHPRMHCGRFGWNWPSGSGEEDFYILLFRNHLPLEKGRALHLYKLQCPSPKDVLCHVWLKLNLWFLRIRFFLISSMYFYYFTIISLGKGWGPSFEQTWNPFTQGWIVPSLVEIDPVVLEKTWKCDKFTTTTTMMDNDGQQTNCDQKSSLEPLA